MDESSSDLSDDFRCTAPLDNLRRRAAMLKQLRGFFDARDFIEVETPLLSADTVVDHHLDPIPVLLPDDPCYLDQGQPLFLQTSPEFAMKRLLASGLGSIYQITHAFRLGERGTRHNPEFTMVEWYRVGDDLQAGINLLGTLACELFAAPRWSAISYQDAFLRETQIDPMQVTSRELLETLRARDVPIPSDSEQDRELLLDAMLTELVEPRLGRNQPEIIFDYPAQQSALARVVQRDEVSVAERFELYYRGIELANGYHELLDAEELLARNRTNNRLRQRDGKALLPEQSRLLAAMQEGLPPCAGTALGFDRLMMLLTGATTIDEVIAFPIDRA